MQVIHVMHVFPLIYFILLFYFIQAEAGPYEREFIAFY